jgi:hypothetical protein
MVAFPGEEAPQPFFRHVGFDGDLERPPCNHHGAIDRKQRLRSPQRISCRLASFSSRIAIE